MGRSGFGDDVCPRIGVLMRVCEWVMVVDGGYVFFVVIVGSLL